MLIRELSVTAALAVLLAVLPDVAGAQELPAPKEVHEVAIDQQVEIARSMAEHEAVAQRFDEEAARFDRQATEHERLAQQYRSGKVNVPKQYSESLAAHSEFIAHSLRDSAAQARDMARQHRGIAHQVTK